MSYWTQMFADTGTPTGMQSGIWDGWGAAATSAGVAVGPDSALKLSTVYACVRLLSETIASLPLVVYQLQADGGRREATNHPLYDLLHDRPNNLQTSIEMRQMMTSHALLRGNAYALIKPGPRGPVDQLEPIHPDIVTPLYMPDGNLTYRVSGGSGIYSGIAPGVYTDDQILHLKGMSFDGKLGVSVVTYMRESAGLGLAAERYAARFFGNGSVPSVVLKRPATMKALSDTAAKRLKSEFEAAHTGINQHRVALLEEGTEIQAVGLSNRDSQFIESREFQAEDIAGRWFGVPPHMIGLTSKATSWGTGIEQMGIGFVVYTLLPWLKRWEQAISRDLILAPQTYFVEHVVSALLRGDTMQRYSAYAIGHQEGWLSPNDIRKMENQNPIDPEDGGDEYVRSVKQVDVGKPPAEGNPQPEPTAPSTPPPSKPARSAHYRALVRETAGRVARREAGELERRVRRGAEWIAAADDFYPAFAETVAAMMHVDDLTARSYTDHQRRFCYDHGPEYLSELENTGAELLIAMTIGDA